VIGRALLVAAVAVGPVACGGAVGDDPAAESSGAAVDASPSATPTATAPAASPAGAEADPEAVFLTTVEEQLEGTDFAGLALADPVGFVATAEVMCDLLEGGASADDVLSVYLVELEEARGGSTDDDAVLSGAVLGAAVGSICPEQGAALVER
jgi:hypothetical protein